jgi:cytochrome b subunit of formate dehydrogenase
MGEPHDGEALKARIRDRVERFTRIPSQHGRAFGLAWAVAGIAIVVAGLVLTVLPGPAMVLIPIGLAMLAGSFAWAAKLLHVSIDRGVDAERWLAALDTRVKVIGVLLLLVAAACAALLLLR